MTCEIRTGIDWMEILAWIVISLEFMVYALAIGTIWAAHAAYKAGMIDSGQASVLYGLTFFCTLVMFVYRKRLET